MHTVHDKEMHKRKRILASEYVLVSELCMTHYDAHDMLFLYVYLCSVHTYPDIFEARDYFLHF